MPMLGQHEQAPVQQDGLNHLRLPAALKMRSSTLMLAGLRLRL